MENKKMTKKEMFGEVITLATENGRQDIVDFANHEIELLNKKSGKSSQTKTQVENENIKAQIVKALREIGKAVTLSPTFKSSLAPGSVTIPQYSCPMTNPIGCPASQ